MTLKKKINGQTNVITNFSYIIASSAKKKEEKRKKKKGPWGKYNYYEMSGDMSSFLANTHVVSSTMWSQITVQCGLRLQYIQLKKSRYNH